MTPVEARMAAANPTPEQKARKAAAKIRKSGGDCAYSWALFIDGREKYNGMSRSEATWRRDSYIKDGKL